MDKPKESKPRLYLDIDGVIYGWYGGQWQVRPYTATLIMWAKEHFDVKWLSFNMREEMIAKVCYVDPIPRTDMNPSLGNITWEKLRGIEADGGLDGDWFIIEDTPPTAEAWEVLNEKGMLHKWILVPETGADVLLEVKIILEGWLAERKLRIPKFWQYADYRNKNLCLYDEWKGPEKYQCTDH
jgi:hypothetical protein